MIFSGVFLCNYARDKAPSAEAIDGYTTTEDGQSFLELDYSEQRIATISLNLKNCDVEIRGGSEDAKVELIGFKPNSYIANVTNKTIKVSNQISIMDYFSLDGSGVSFAGVWRTLLSLTGEQKEVTPEVIVYVPADQDIKQFNLTFDNCNVNMVNLVGKTEYSIVSNKAKIDINTLGASIVDISCDDTEISAINATIDHLTYDMAGGNFVARNLISEDMVFSGKEGEINLIDADFADFNLKMTQCDLTISTVYTQGSYQRAILVEDGEIYLGDLLLGKEDFSPEGETAPGKLTITLEEGKVVTKYGDRQLVLEDEAPTTSEPPASGEPNASDAT
jgi:hypothetical protein